MFCCLLFLLLLLSHRHFHRLSLPFPPTPSVFPPQWRSGIPVEREREREDTKQVRNEVQVLSLARAAECINLWES